jgi:hypothetical protein
MEPRGLRASSLVLVVDSDPTVASSASVLKVIRKGICLAERKEGKHKIPAPCSEAVFLVVCDPSMNEL